MEENSRKKRSSFDFVTLYTSISHEICFMINITYYYMCGALRDLVPFVQFKKREKHPWCFLNCAHATKSRNATHILSLLIFTSKYQRMIWA